MSGFRLFRHAVLMVIDNIAVALRISFLPFLGLGAATYFVAVFLVQAAPPGTEGAGATSVSVILALLTLYVIVYVWVAVGWHRYVLLSIEPGPAWPLWSGAKIWAYVVAVLRLIPLSLLLGLIAGIIFSIPAAIFNNGSVSTNDGTVLGFLLGVTISYIAMRLSLVLPAAAIGEFMRVPDAWAKTKSFSKPIFVAALCVGVLTAIPNLLLLTPLAPILGSVMYSLVAQWFILMLGISMLTALYGHIVEGRELR